mmetsp:Transcript_37845/g.51225  ORF Transcript_37845/g.51225 Transcript_37845/m.51225 type:complete len:263 (-) Transcript_37845:325-1113(-)
MYSTGICKECVSLPRVSRLEGTDDASIRCNILLVLAPVILPTMLSASLTDMLPTELSDIPTGGGYVSCTTWPGVVLTGSEAIVLDVTEFTSAVVVARTLGKVTVVPASCWSAVVAAPFSISSFQRFWFSDCITLHLSFVIQRCASTRARRFFAPNKSFFTMSISETTSSSLERVCLAIAEVSLVLRLMNLSILRFPRWKLGCLNSRQLGSCRVFEKAYMFNWRTKDWKFECLKNLGSTLFAKLSTFFMSMLCPSMLQQMCSL